MDIRPSRGRRAAQQTTTILAPIIHRNVRPWASSEINYNSLQAFVENSQPWSREGVPLPRRLTCLLWASIPAELAWGIWLVTVLTGDSHCDGRICAVATLGNHPGILLACAAICIAGLAALVPGTRGLSRCNGRQVAGMAAASTAGGVALLGIASLIVGAVIGLLILAAIVAIALAALLAFADTS
jgi:hypothetical protein